MAEECLCLFLALCGRDEGDCEAEDVGEVFVRRLREDGVLLDADRHIAHVIDHLSIDTTEVARARERDVVQLVEEVEHARAAERDLESNDVALADLEGRDRLLGATRRALLSRNCGETVLDQLYLLLILDLSGTGRDDHLGEAWRLELVLIAKLAFQRLVAGLVLGARCCSFCHIILRV